MGDLKSKASKHRSFKVLLKKLIERKKGKKEDEEEKKKPKDRMGNKNANKQLKKIDAE